jgi:3-hydroxyacyl-CoA dehydrogenase
MTETPQVPTDQLMLTHELAVLRKTLRLLTAVLEAMQEEPGRETLTVVDQMLVEAGWIGRSTQQGVLDLITQRNVHLEWGRQVRPFLNRLAQLDDPDNVEAVRDRRTITLNDIIAEAQRLQAL